MKKIIYIIFLIAFLFGCTSPRISRNLSSGVIGCRPDDITIENETATAIGSMHNWEAICNGKRYICSYQPTTGCNCKELVK